MEAPRVELASTETNNRFFKALIGFFFLLWTALVLFFFGNDFFCFTMAMFAVSWVLIFQAITSVEIKPDVLEKSNKQDNNPKRELNLSELMGYGIISLIFLAIVAFILLLMILSYLSSSIGGT